jgi:hypothetical protein
MIGVVLLVTKLTSEPYDPRVPSSEALVACHTAVKTELRNPATLDFQTLTETISDTAGKAGWRVTGAGTAKTGFGVERDFTYTCTTDDMAAVQSHTVTPG